MVESRATLLPGCTELTDHSLQYECPDIYMDEHIMSLKFSPVQNVLALGQITGEFRVFSYDLEETTEQLYLQHHKESVRSIDFSPDGAIVYCASADKSISVISRGRLEGQMTNAHDECVNKIMHLEDNHLIASGDDDGVIKIWDLRLASQGKKASVIQFTGEKTHDGTITDMDFHADTKWLFTSANDGTLGVFDLRKPSLYAMSDSFCEDQSGVSIMKLGKKVVTSSAGSEGGVINIFSWDWFGDCNDRIVGHPGAIECMIKFDEDTLITGGEDGLIRAVGLLPNRILAIMSDPLDQEEGFNIQALSLSHDRKLLASTSPDDIVKIIDVSSLEDRPTDGSFDLAAYEQSLELKANHGKTEAKRHKADNNSDDWGSDSDNSDDDDSDMDSDSDSSDDDKMVDESKHKKKNKQLNQKKANTGQSKKMIQQAKAKDFFKDM